MQDTNVTFKFETVGLEEASAKVRKLGGVIKSITEKQNGMYAVTAKLNPVIATQGKNIDNVARATGRAAKAQQNYFLHIAKTTVQSALINKLFLEFVDVAGQAIQQVDLMANFPATMASMGESTKDASEAMDTLRTYVGQVGGNLGDATSYVTRFTGATKDVKAATAIFVGLNNALIAGDSSMEEQRQATIQFAQALERGKPDMREWRSLVQNMSFQMAQVATAMGYVNANALGEALTSGKESMAEFATTLTKLSTNSGDIEKQTYARMNGLQFSFNVLKNTLTQGLAAIINAFGRQNIVAFFKAVTSAVIVLTGWIVTLINWLGTLINFIVRLFGGKNVFGKIEGDAAGVASNLGAGAGAAEDLGDGLDGAAGSAKKLNKSLASFDKMNVLPDKESGGDSGGGKDAGAGGGGSFDPGQIGELNDLFGGLGKGIQEASKWAKILAGIIAGLAANALINKIFGYNIIKEFGKAVWKHGILPLLAFGKTAVLTAARVAGTLGVALGRGLLGMGSGGSGIYGTAASIGAKIGLALRGGFLAIFSGIGTLLRAVVLNPIMNLLKLIWIPIAAAASAIAAALGIPFAVAVAIVAAIVAVIIGLFYVIYRNWDTIWGAINKVSSAAWQKIQGVWDGITKFFVDLWADIQSVWDGITEFFVNLWHGVYAIFMSVVDFLREWGLTILAVLLWPITFFLAGVILVVTAVYGFFKWLWEQIVAVWNVVAPWFAELFQKAWDGIVNIWNAVVGFFKGVWDGIVEIFTEVTEWFKKVFSAAWDGIVEIWNTVSEWFDTNVILPIIAVFTPVLNFLKKLFSDAWEGIKSVWNTVAGWFGTAWTNIKNAFGDVAKWFGDKFQDAWNRVTGIFASLWTWFKTNVWDKIVSVFSAIGTTVADAISGAFKGVVNTVLRGVVGIINGFFGAINGAIDVINKVPGVSIKKVPKLDTPQLARGGVVEQATMALIGESGAEAVVPLENNTEWIDKLASKINGASGGGQPIQLTIQIGEEKIVTRVIDLINEKTQMSGRNAIYV